jgi:hypothetical protein
VQFSFATFYDKLNFWHRYHLGMRNNKDNFLFLGKKQLFQNRECVN